MKKFLSIFIALLLVISLFATTTIAFAEGETDETEYSVTYEAGEHGTGTAPAEASYAAGTKVKLAAADTFTANDGYEFAGWKVTSFDDKTFAAEEEFEMPAQNVTVTAQWSEPRDVRVNVAELAKNLALGCDWFSNLKIEMGDIKFGETMMKDSALVEAAFPGIRYYTEDTDEHKKSDSDVIYIEYCRPSESPKGQKTWQNSAKITDNIRISSSGWYLFRFVVKDSASKQVLAVSNSEYTNDNTDYYLNYYAEDTSRPVVALSTTMKNKVESGLTAGTKYSIPTSGLTSGSTDEMSSTTVTFKIYKFVNGNWTTDPIYDSATKEIAEGYEDFVDKDGAITPSNGDISKNDEPIYKVVYTVTDAYGFTGVENKDDVQKYDPALKFEPEMLLKVVAAPAEDNKSVNVWEIVLFCIAGLSAIGIVVLLCIKPKETVPAGKANAVTKEENAETTDEKKE